MKITHVQVEQCRDMIQSMKFEKKIDTSKEELRNIFNFHRERLDSAHLNYDRKLFVGIRQI